MMFDDLVSVVIPVFNAEKYVREAIKSIQEQSHKRLEIICVDDCSTDGSPKILEEMAERDNRIVVMRNRKNLGIVGTLNKAISRCSGAVIARMDADDVAVPQRIEKQLSFLKNGGYDLVGSPVIYITENGETIGQSDFYTPTQLIKFLRYKSTLGHPTWMIYANIYRSLAGYREMAPAEDYDFILRAVKANVKIAMTKEPLLMFRTQSKSGGTALSQGLIQRKMFNYARKINRGLAVYSKSEVEIVKSVSGFAKKLFYFSQILYYRATLNKHNNKYTYAFLYLIASIIISPHQFQFVLRASILKFKMIRSCNENKF
jgi:glycosyltransferase involved in cell wall biosynthesis